MRQPSKGSTSFAPYFVLLRNPYFLSLFFPLTPIPPPHPPPPPFPSLTIFVSLFLWRRRVPFSLADLAFRRRPFRFFLASASRTRYGKRADSPFVYPASDNDRVSASICPLTVLFLRRRAAYRDERSLTTGHGTRQTRAGSVSERTRGRSGRKRALCQAC